MSTTPEIPSTTSYSDPIYDRLESLSQKIRRRIVLFVAILATIVVVAVVVHRVFQETPVAASAAAFMKAGERNNFGSAPAGDEDSKANDAYRALVDNPTIVPLFQARAAIEMIQFDLNNGKLDDARAHAAKATELAAKTDNKDLVLAVQLSSAAVHMQAGEFSQAEEAYIKVENAAGAKYPDRQLAAILGAALALEKQGKVDEAITKLDPVVNRTDSVAQRVLDLGRAHYWRMKRTQAEKAAAPAASTEIPTASAVVDAATAAASAIVPEVVAPVTEAAVPVPANPAAK